MNRYFELPMWFLVIGMYIVPTVIPGIYLHDQYYQEYTMEIVPIGGSESRSSFDSYSCSVTDGTEQLNLRYKAMCEKIELNKKYIFDCYGWGTEFLNFSPYCYGFSGEENTKPVDLAASVGLIFVATLTWAGIFSKITSYLERKKTIGN